MLKDYNISDFIILVVCSLLLLPVVFYPVTTDSAIFIEAGRIITEGGKPYVDFIDIKPPAIYYLFSLIYSVFGNGETTVRFFDFLLQVITVILLYRLIARYSPNKKAAALAAIFYSLSYTTLAHNQTLQIESWIPLLSIIMLGLILNRKDTKSNFLLIGLVAGIITALKFTMIFVILALPISDFLSGERNYKEIFRRFLWTAAGFVIVILISLLPFLDYEVRRGFSNVWIYLNMYAEYPIINELYIRNTLKAIGKFFGDKYSILFTFSFLYGLLITVKVRKKDVSGIGHILNAAFSILLLLALSVIAEKKFFDYHFSRMYALMSLFVGIGFAALFKLVHKAVIKNKRTLIVILPLAAFLFLMSPVPRWVAIVRSSSFYFFDKEKYNNYYSRPWEGSAVNRNEQIQTADYIIRNSKQGDEVFVVSVASSIINYHLGQLAQSSYMLSCFFISSADIKPWVDEAFSELENSDWVVLQDDDPSYIANRHSLSSRKYILQNNRFGKYLINNFKLDKVIGKFYIYKRVPTQEK